MVISKNTSAVVSATSGSLVTGMRTAGFGGKRGGGEGQQQEGNPSIVQGLPDKSQGKGGDGRVGVSENKEGKKITEP